MSGEEPTGEKNFEATDKRKRDAANKGDVLRSKELATAAAIFVGATWMSWAGGWLFEGLVQSLHQGLVWDRADVDDFAPGSMMMTMMIAVLPPIFVLGALIIASSLVSQLGFGTGIWVPKNLSFKGSRINPLNGLKRMFGPTGLIEIAKGLGKIGLLGGIAWAWGLSHFAGLTTLGRGDLAQQLGFAWDALITLAYWLGAGLLIIAFADVPVQFFRRNKRLKMTLQEVRDESKEQDGSPEQKAAIRDRQRKMAMGAMAPAMREAQFVITNPTHFSVALTYDPERAEAPILLAKGRGEKALAMRELAAEMKLPVLEYPSLARALYFTTREKQIIRHELYGAVAAILAFVFSIKRGESRDAPNVNIPVELRFDADGKLVTNET